mgnify:CR=1 FL=1
MGTPTEDLTWCTAAEDERAANIRLKGTTTRRAGRKEGFKVLGTMIASGNIFDVDVENRLARATRTFWANWELLGCVSIPLAKRLHEFRATVEASFLWCAGSWNLTIEQLRRIMGPTDASAKEDAATQTRQRRKHDGAHYQG